MDDVRWLVCRPDGDDGRRVVSRCQDDSLTPEASIAICHMDTSRELKSAGKEVCMEYGPFPRRRLGGACLQGWVG